MRAAVCNILSLLFLLLTVFADVDASETISRGLSLIPNDRIAISEIGEAYTYAVEIAASISGNRNRDGKSKACWGIEWTDKNGFVIMRATVGWHNTDFGNAFDRRYLTLSVSKVSSSGSEKLFSTDLDKNVELYGGKNCLWLEANNGNISFHVGSEVMNYAGSVKTPSEATSMMLFATRPLKVEYMACRIEKDVAATLDTDMNACELESYFETVNNDVEGKWAFLDRDTDSRYSELGGRYELAVVSIGFLKKHQTPENYADMMKIYPSLENEGSFAVVLMSGASVNSRRWKPFMIKGFLIPTIFDRHYTLLWYDSYMNLMANEMSADISADDAILTLTFPLNHAIMRFSRCR